MANGKTQLTLRTRLLFWRARLSTPAMLACRDEKQVLARVSPISSAVVILTISLFAWLTNLPLVFPALGPSTFILFTAPLSKAGAPRSVVLGHLSCLAGGTLVYHSVSFLTGQPISLDHVNAPLVLSAALALALAVWTLVKLNCPHPPACASSLVVALGGLNDPLDLLLTAAVIVWLAAEAVFVNRLAGLPVPLWKPPEHPETDPILKQCQPHDKSKVTADDPVL